MQKDLALSYGFRTKVTHAGLILSRATLFAAFGIGAVLIAYVGFPVIHLFYALARIRGSDRSVRAEQATQRLVQQIFWHYVRFAEVIRGFRVHFEHPERLHAEGGNLIIANHPTLLDVVILISHLPQADCVVKRGAWRNPFLGGVVRAAGYIPNEGGRDLIDACAERLQAGNTLLLFPEGTRSPRGELGEFSRGVAHVALASGCRVTPVTITCDPPSLGRGEPWYSGSHRTLEYSVRVDEAFDTKEFLEVDVPGVVAARRLTAELRSYFERRLQHDDS